MKSLPALQGAFCRAWQGTWLVNRADYVHAASSRETFQIIRLCQHLAIGTQINVDLSLSYQPLFEQSFFLRKACAPGWQHMLEQVVKTCVVL